MKNQGGFTLIEIILALAILLSVLVSLVTLTGKSVHVATTSDREQAAIQLATDRTDQVRADPNYASLASTYATTETSFPTLPGFQRVTTVVHTTTGGHDYKKVTVTISGPGLLTPIKRTVAVAAR